MVKEKRQLEEQIETLRNKMYESYNTNQSSDEVLRISQQLDLLINESHRLTLQEKLLSKSYVPSHGVKLKPSYTKA